MSVSLHHPVTSMPYPQSNHRKWDIVFDQERNPPMPESVKTAFCNPELFQNGMKMPLQDVAFTKWVAVAGLKNVTDFFLAYLFSQNLNEHGINANFADSIRCLGCLLTAFP